jgi:membrane protein implicated in regulation of membrane protease activity
MNWIMINLALAVIWLFLGAGILVVEAIRGQSLFGGVIISPGWLCLLLAVYNGVRVATMWKLVKEQRQAQEEEEKEREQFLQRPAEVVNPELRLTEEKKFEDRG